MNKNTLLFLLPSLLGVLIFLTPVPWDGHLTIGIGIITDWIRSLMGDYGLHIVVALMVTTSTGRPARPSPLQWCSVER